MHESDGETGMSKRLDLVTHGRSAGDRTVSNTRSLPALLQNIPLPYVLLDEAGRIIDFNHAYRRITGYSKREILNIASDLELTAPHWRTFQKTILDSVRTTGYPQVFRKEYLRKNGTTVPVMVFAYLYQTPQGISYCLAIAETVKPPREEFRSSISDVLDILPDPAFTIDRDGLVTAWNRAMTALTGIRAEEVLGTGSLECSCYFYGCQKSMLIDRALELGKEIEKARASCSNNYPLLTSEEFYPAVGKKGSYLWSRATPFFDRQGNLSGAVEIMRDVTQRRESEERLRQQEEHYLNILESIKEGCFEVDLGGNMLYYNNPVRLALADADTDIFGLNYRQYMTRETARKVYRAFKKVHSTKQPLDDLVFEIIRKDGSTMHVEASITPVLNDSGSVTGYRGIVRDVTQRIKAEKALRESEQKYRLVFENSPMGIIHFDHQGNITTCNQQAARLFNMKRQDMLHINLLHLADRKMVYAVKKALSGQVGIYEGKYQINNGVQTVSLEIRFAPIKSDNGTVAGGVGIIADVTDRKQYEDTIRQVAYHDPLTGLPNRMLFYDRLGLALSQARRSGQLVAVILLDLDNFKLINDTFSHSVGDRLLQEVARRLSRMVRAGDTVSRIGGDEFVILLPGVSSAAEALAAAKKLQLLVEEPFEVDNEELRITASIGISIYPESGQDVSTLLKNADAALYCAREHGRSQCRVFSPDMNNGVIQRLSMESKLRQALTNQEFVLHYQPVIDLQAGRITGLEALIRWNHPSQGLILPGSFIYVAEETGLIVPIEKWVLKTACLQIKSWQDAGLRKLRVAVNISSYHLLQQDLVQTVEEVLHETGMNPCCLELEITESVAMQNPAWTIRVLHGLRSLGIQIALDDFGTGYSSLSYLKNLPVDSLKIDQSFIRDLTADASNLAISRAVISLGKSLNLKVTAEGVEMPEQLEILKKLQCDRIQGYLFSRPQPAPAITDLLQKYSHRPWELLK